VTLLLLLASQDAMARRAPAWKGSVPVSGNPSHDALLKMAKVTEADARKTALAAIPGDAASKTIAEGELEAENGYLVWSFDIKSKGEQGVSEVLVDAGNGQVLDQSHEGPAKEAREAVAETKEPAPAASDNPAVHGVALPGAPPEGVMMDILACDRARHRVWVPAGNTGSVDVIDTKTEQVTRIEGFATKEVERKGTKRTVGPSSASVGDGVVYVGSRGDDSACAIDAVSLKRGPCVTLESMPDLVAWVASTKEVWVTAPRDKRIIILDAATPLALTVKTTLTLDGEPECFAVDNERGVFYTNLEDKDRTVALDLKTHQVTHTWESGCGEDGPKGLALDDADNFLVVACKDHVTVLDSGHEGQRLSTMATGDGVDAIDYLASAREVFVGAGKAGQLVVLRLDAKGVLTTVATVPTAAGARNAVATDDGSAWLSDSHEGKVLVVAPAALH
jgi:DNA-binding beta-propeller fold protein YncE